MPVAQIDQTINGDVITYIHTDHLNTPRRGTDINGITVWAWQGTAFGSFSANEDPDNDGTNTTINLRFPGQVYDQETKLHYNYFRYYDPSTGRYITSDPIGLKGGLNTYGYVGGNPGRWVDPWGLIHPQDYIDQLLRRLPRDARNYFNRAAPYVSKATQIHILETVLAAREARLAAYLSAARLLTGAGMLLVPNQAGCENYDCDGNGIPDYAEATPYKEFLQCKE